MTDIRAELEAMRAREQAATPGPWEFHADSWYGQPVWRMGSKSVMADIANVPHYPHVAQPASDAEFIAHSRTDMGRLLDAVEAVLGLADSHEQVADLAPMNPGAAAHRQAARGILAALTEHLGVRRKILDDLSREGYANSPHGEGFDEHLGGRDE